MVEDKTNTTNASLPPLVSISVMYSDGAKMFYPNVVEYSIDIWAGYVSCYTIVGARTKIDVNDTRLVVFWPQKDGFVDRAAEYTPAPQPDSKSNADVEPKRAMGFHLPY